MTLTKGFLGYPVTLTADAFHFTVTYDDATTQNVTLAAGTYYVQGDGGATDLLFELEDALNTDASDGDTWTVEATDTGLPYRCKITATGGKTPTLITFNSELDNVLLGFAATSPTFTLGIATGSHRMAPVWHPEEETFEDEADDDDEVIQALTASQGVTDTYSRMGSITLAWPRVYGALVLDTYASVPGHASNAHASLLTTDPNATLQSWLRRVRALTGGDTPLLRWTPDRDTPGTYYSVILPKDAYAVKGWVQARNLGPLWYALGITMRTPAS